MFYYNEGRNFSSVVVAPNGGYIVMATNVKTRETMEMSNVIQSLDEAILRAKRLAGYSYTESLDPDAVEQYLSERLGF